MLLLSSAHVLGKPSQNSMFFCHQGLEIEWTRHGGGGAGEASARSARAARRAHREVERLNERSIRTSCPRKKCGRKSVDILAIALFRRKRVDTPKLLITADDFTSLTAFLAGSGGARSWGVEGCDPYAAFGVAKPDAAQAVFIGECINQPVKGGCGSAGRGAGILRSAGGCDRGA